MIHTFKYDSLFIALDVESGAVHCVDETAFAILEAMERGIPRAEALELAAERFGESAANEVMQELIELECERVLGAPEVVVPVPTDSPVKSMCLNVAHDCNLRCRYCFASEGGYGEKRALMSAETGKKALEFLMEHSGGRHNLEVDFFGGEPMMNIDVVKELTAYGRELEKKYDKKIAFTITTNCVIMDDETVEFFDREMKNVVISVDGRKEVHDAMRPTANGKGSFDIVMNNAKKLGLARQKAEKEYYIRGTFTNKNLDFDRDVLFLADEGFEQISIEPAVLEKGSPYELTERELPEIFDRYDRLAKEFYERRKNGKWFNFFHFMIDLEDGPCVAKRLKGCGAGSEYVAVTPSGDIYPCHQFVGDEKFKMGSVLTGEIDENKREYYRGCTVRTKPACSKCWAKYYCSGGCLANAQHINGDIYRPFELACKMLKKRLECAIGIYIQEHAE